MFIKFRSTMLPVLRRSSPTHVLPLRPPTKVDFPDGVLRSLSSLAVQRRTDNEEFQPESSASRTTFSGLFTRFLSTASRWPTRRDQDLCRTGLLRRPPVTHRHQVSTGYSNSAVDTNQRTDSVDAAGGDAEFRSTVDVVEGGRFAVVHCRQNRSTDCSDDGLSSLKLHATWLRHNCQCSECVQRGTGQKLVRPAQLASSYLVKSVDVVVPSDTSPTANDDVIRVQWREDEHVSEYPTSFLIENVPSPTDRRVVDGTPTDFMSAGCPLPSVDYNDLVLAANKNNIISIDSRAVMRWLRLINDFGICVVRRTPIVDGHVVSMAELICPVQATIYGKAWNVRSEPDPINVAYSDAELDLHMDLSYYESPPGLQFLHCFRFDECVEGGESLFVDAWHAAETMRVERPEEFRVLTRIPATFQKIHFERDRPASMRYRRPHIVLEPESDRIVAIYWAPPFEGPLDVADEKQLDDYYRAYSTYASLLVRSPTLVARRLERGDLVCFNNRRVLHGRHSFKLNGGSRHLQGCYVNIDEFKSRLRVMIAQTHRDDVSPSAPAPPAPVKHVFNNCWS